jgi:hypothetical protein
VTWKRGFPCLGAGRVRRTCALLRAQRPHLDMHLSSPSACALPTDPAPWDDSAGSNNLGRSAMDLHGESLGTHVHAHRDLGRYVNTHLSDDLGRRPDCLFACLAFQMKSSSCLPRSAKSWTRCSWWLGVPSSSRCSAEQSSLAHLRAVSHEIAR